MESDTRRSAEHQAAKVLEKAGKLKTKSKDLLSQIYHNIQKLFEEKDVFQELKTEMVTEFGYDIKCKILECLEDIEDDNCPVVIAGETSAGKSTFINLLLGMDLMPQHCLACTSTICRIWNNPNKEVYVTNVSNIKTNVYDSQKSPMDNKDLKCLLQKYVCKKPAKKADEQSTEHAEEYKYVDVHWPIPCLQKNVVIVDTPGIGPDHPELTKRLFEYLHKALVFIYILNSPNDGGVHSDRILLIKEEIEKQSQKQTGKQFDPSRTIFICNKWDQIFEEPDETLTQIKTVLKTEWPGFQEDKLYTLSTREALFGISQGQPISDAFMKVLKGIENMIPGTIEFKIHRHLEWQQYFIDRMHLKVLARIRTILLSKEEMMKIIRDHEQSIQKLKKELKTEREHIQFIAAGECRRVVQNIYDHLTNETTRGKMFPWCDEELPEFDEINKIESCLQKMILYNVNKQIRSKLNEGVIALTECIKNLFNRALSNIGYGLKEIDKIILGEYECLLGVENNHAKEIPSQDILDVLALNPNKPFSMLLAVPLSLLGGIFVAISVIPLSIWINRNNKHRVKEYKSDKSKYAYKMGTTYLESITIQTLQKDIGDKLLENVELRITEYFDNVIPNRIAAGEALIQNMRNDLKCPMDIREQCYNTESCILPVYGLVVLAHMELFTENVIQKEDVKVSQQHPSNHCGKCEIRLDGHWSQADMIYGKSGRNSYKGLVELAEMSMLRKCSHPNIVVIYGISIFDRFTIYMETCSYNLDKAVIVDKLNWNRCKNYLKESLDGLNYLHHCGLAHKNLRLENIQIKENKAKLSGCGIGKWESLTGPIEGVPIIPAPEVLQNGYWGYEADMFQFGVVVWECWYKKRALWKYDKPVNATYEELYRAIREGQMPLFPEPKPRKDFLSMINTCWDKNPNARPSAKGFQYYIGMLEELEIC